MKIQLRRITLLFTAALMSASLTLVSCDKEKEANPTFKGSTALNSARTDVDEMPDDFIVMNIPAEYSSSSEYQGSFESFVETEIVETGSGPVSVEYYIKGDDEGKIAVFAIEPTSFNQLGLSQDFYFSEEGSDLLGTTSKGLITCLRGCSNAVPKVAGCGGDCWKEFVKDQIDAWW